MLPIYQVFRTVQIATRRELLAKSSVDAMKPAAEKRAVARGLLNRVLCRREYLTLPSPIYFFSDARIGVM